MKCLLIFSHNSGLTFPIVVINTPNENTVSDFIIYEWYDIWSQGLQKDIICGVTMTETPLRHPKIFQNPSMWTFVILIIILMVIKNPGNYSWVFPWSQGFQKGIICGVAMVKMKLSSWPPILKHCGTYEMNPLVVTKIKRCIIWNPLSEWFYYFLSVISMVIWYGNLLHK